MFEVLRPTRKYFPHMETLWRHTRIVAPTHNVFGDSHAGTGRVYCRPKAYRRDVIFLPCIYSRRRQYVPKSVAYCRSCL